MTAAGVYVSWQVASVPAGDSVQLPPDPNDPGLSLEKLTVPDGAVFVPPSVSLTVAVHVVTTPTATDPGTQATAALDERFVTGTPPLPLLVLCVGSPL